MLQRRCSSSYLNYIRTFLYPSRSPHCCVHRDKKKEENRSLNYIDNIHIGTLLRDAAKSVISIASKKELARFTVHYIQMRFCGIMHTNESSTSMIKVRLRWKSYAFKIYLRNVESLAKYHRDVLRKA